MPSPSDSVCTCFRLRRAARQVSQIYDHELAAVGLSLNEYSIPVSYTHLTLPTKA